IVGMPVGFVNVVESKKLLDGVKVPWIRLNGRRGGSPFAVATLHGIMENELK
ncbi:MAG: precorrin-8X methylmutase, partial [Lentisphaeria bacterium]|nr:precorrin-8X methylmutase [Lentisphaeria bacterium]